MITFLLLFCIVLIAIAFLLIIVLFQRYSSIKDLERKQSTIIQEMEQMITVHLLEMKEENEVFLNKMQHYDLNSEYKNTKGTDGVSKIDTGNIDVTEKIITKQELDDILPDYGQDKDNNKETNVHPIVPIKSSILNNEEFIGNSTNSSGRDDLYVQSLSAQALLLQKKGDTIEQIAKKLGRGKTEIELLLKFRQN